MQLNEILKQKAHQVQNKNERYSKVVSNDDEIDELKMCEFQKALSLPININKTFNAKISSPEFLQNDNFLNEMIDENEEDKKSVDDSDSSEEDMKFISK